MPWFRSRWWRADWWSSRWWSGDRVAAGGGGGLPRPFYRSLEAQNATAQHLKLSNEEVLKGNAMADADFMARVEREKDDEAALLLFFSMFE